MESNLERVVREGFERMDQITAVAIERLEDLKLTYTFPIKGYGVTYSVKLTKEEAEAMEKANKYWDKKLKEDLAENVYEVADWTKPYEGLTPTSTEEEIKNAIDLAKSISDGNQRRIKTILSKIPGPFIRL